MLLHGATVVHLLDFKWPRLARAAFKRHTDQQLLRCRHDEYVLVILRPFAEILSVPIHIPPNLIRTSELEQSTRKVGAQ